VDKKLWKLGYDNTRRIRKYLEMDLLNSHVCCRRHISSWCHINRVAG